ncbi:MAG: hypothetical protein ACD_79C01024G0001 [uncultured bacterium]|nr:MAG: hypothetical protein ACD_79C01024G0001 [uncultured bacterium]
MVNLGPQSVQFIKGWRYLLFLESNNSATHLSQTPVSCVRTGLGVSLIELLFIVKELYLMDESPLMHSSF